MNAPQSVSSAGPAGADVVLDVVCLCAAWCRTCTDYEEVFRQVGQALPRHRYRWVDIEDEADLAGDVDVETFPTLMLAHEGRVLFAGPVLPRAADAKRLIETSTEQIAAGSPPPSLSGVPSAQQLAFEQLARAVAAGRAQAA